VGYWDQAPLPRDQIVLIATTLGDRIPDDHPVRLFHDILASIDWSAWQNHYCQVAGQPAIPPMVVAGAILYGLSQGIRSSRRLEWACGNAVDFMWLVEGRQIDHSTFCNFRTRFEQELKDLFRQIGRLAMKMGLIRLNEVSLDGTRVLANSSRHSTASAKTLAEREAELDKQIEECFARIQQQDGQHRDLFGESYSPHTLPPELADLKKRQAALKQALEAAQAADAKRHTGQHAVAEAATESAPADAGDEDQRKQKRKKAAKVPVADPQAVILPNKEGGYAPNYTPVTAVDGERGFIADADVISTATEAQTVIPTVQRIEENLGAVPQQLLADTAFATGQNLTDLQARSIEPFMPVERARLDEKNPAVRPDATQPVAEAEWPNLPRNPQSKKLDKAAFVYDASQDCYHCPMGRRMNPAGLTRDRKSCGESIYQLYRCTDCGGCPLREACLGKAAQQRTVARDQHEPVREALAARMRSPAGRQTYARRAWMAETPHAFIKAVMGVRRFLLRGLEKVRTEWRWACTAFNLQKLVKAIAAMRAKVAMVLG
jgi:transposase